jgi:hypothetical protein
VTPSELPTDFFEMPNKPKESPMKRGILIACLIGLVAAVGARAADEPPANPPGQHGPMRGGMDLLPPRVLEKLALTADQKTKYDALDASFKKDVAKWRSSQSSGGEGTSTGTTNNVSSNRKGLRDLHKGYIDQLRPTLTSDQAVTLDKALENMRNNRGGHSGTNAAAKPPTPPTNN